MLYRTRAGDRLDWIVWRQYGRISGLVERVYEANPGLADRERGVFEAGVLIDLPEIAEPERRRLIRVFD